MVIQYLPGLAVSEEAWVMTRVKRGADSLRRALADLRIPWQEETIGGESAVA